MEIPNFLVDRLTYMIAGEPPRAYSKIVSVSNHDPLVFTRNDTVDNQFSRITLEIHQTNFEP